MAGSIFISKELRLPVSTLQFDYLTERIRRAFDADGERFRRQIFAPEDEGEMKFISAENEDGEGVRAFYRAVVSAQSKAATEDGYDCSPGSGMTFCV